ncbi:MAG: hypothetical protein AB9903_04195 [Vulcanimicrobiota bacterium]
MAEHNYQHYYPAKEKKYTKFCPNEKGCYTIIDYDDCEFSYTEKHN